MVTGATNNLLQDSTYSSEASQEKHHLSIQFSQHCLTAAVLDIDSNKYQCLEQISFANDSQEADLSKNLKQAIEQSELLKHRYKSCDATVVNSLSTLVPDALFESEKVNEYVQFNFGEFQDLNTSSDHISSLSVHNAYQVPKEATSLLTERFPSVRIKHHSTVFIDTLLRQARHDAGTNVYVNVRADHVDVLVLDQKSLKFYNTFAYQSDSDLVYFILHVVEQLKLDANKTPVTLVGEIRKNSDAHSMLEKYIAKLEFGKRNYVFRVPYEFSSLQEQEHFVLLHQFLCA